jgi:hypothetical protein
MPQKSANLKSGRLITFNAAAADDAVAAAAAADDDDDDDVDGDDDDDDRRTSCYEDESNTKSLGRAYYHSVTHRIPGNSSNPLPSKIGQAVKLVTDILEVHDPNLRLNITYACCFRGFPELLEADAGIFSDSRTKRLFSSPKPPDQLWGPQSLLFNS